MERFSQPVMWGQRGQVPLVPDPNGSWVRFRDHEARENELLAIAGNLRIQLDLATKDRSPTPPSSSPSPKTPASSSNKPSSRSREGL